MKFIVTYWSQITFLLLGCGYFIKQFVGHWIKLKETRFNVLQIERANLIKEMYRELMILNEDISIMNSAHSFKSMNMGPTAEEWQLLFHKIVSQNALISKNFRFNRILFAKKFGAKMDNLFQVVMKEFIETSLNVNVIIQDESKDLTFTNSPRFQKYYAKDFKILLNELEREFRNYL